MSSLPSPTNSLQSGQESQREGGEVVTWRAASPFVLLWVACLRFLGVCCCGSHPEQKQLEEEGFIWFITDYNPPLREAKAGTQGSKLEAGPKAEAMEELSCSL